MKNQHFDVLKRSFDWTNLWLFLNCFWLFLISWWTVIPIKFLISFKLFSSHIFFIVDLFVSYLLDQRTLNLKLVLWCDIKYSVGHIPNQTYGFYLPTALWKVMERVPVFVISPVAINTLIRFKEVNKVIKFLICIVSVGPMATKDHCVNPSQLFSYLKLFNKKLSLFCCLCFDNCFGC